MNRVKAIFHRGTAGLRRRPLALAIAAVIATAGCAQLPEQAAQSRVVVQIATMKVIEAGDNRAMRAAQVAKYAGEAKRLAGKAVGLDELEGALQQRVAEDQLDPADAAMADVLIGAVVAELRLRTGGGGGRLPVDQLYQVDELLDWVIAATRFY